MQEAQTTGAVNPGESIVLTPSPKRSFGGKNILFGIIGLTVLVIGVFTGLLLVQRQQNLSEKAAGFSPIECPLTQTENNYIIQFNGNYVRSDLSQTEAELGPVTTAIPPGTYQVTLVSYEKDHPTHPTQPQESWYLQLKDTSGTTFAQTNSIADMPDQETVKQQVVNTTFEIPQTVYSVMAYHSAFPNTSSPNSINPVCASFETIVEITPSPSPTQEPIASSSAELTTEEDSLFMQSFEELLALASPTPTTFPLGGNPTLSPTPTTSPTTQSIASQSAFQTIPPDLPVTGVREITIAGVVLGILLLLGALVLAV